MPSASLINTCPSHSSQYPSSSPSVLTTAVCFYPSNAGRIVNSLKPSLHSAISMNRNSAPRVLVQQRITGLSAPILTIGEIHGGDKSEATWRRGGHYKYGPRCLRDDQSMLQAELVPYFAVTADRQAAIWPWQPQNVSLGNSEGLGGDRQGPSLGNHRRFQMGTGDREYWSLFFEQHPQLLF